MVRVVANVSCEAENITDIQIVGAYGSFSSDLAKVEGSPMTWYKNLTWIPSKSGQYSICSKATDTSLLASVSSCFTLLVGEPDPNVNYTTVWPTGELISNGADSVQIFNCTFTVNVKKPSQKALIRVYHALTNIEVYSINSASPNTTVFFQPNIMWFQIPIGLLPDGEYYILFDYGN